VNSHHTQGSDDDPAAYEDLKRLAERLGNEALSLTKEGDGMKIIIKKR
jgi:TusA-related sulfurtransferase